VTAALAAALALAVVLGVLAWARSERLARRVDRLTRLAARDAAELERLRRADPTVVERLPDPLLLLDARRAVLRANAAATAAFGSELGAVLRHPGLRAAIERAFASGTTESADLSLPVPVPREVRGTVVPLDPPLADGGQALVVLSDRTRERAVERMRADFVANASHELRTPLASVIGFIDTLRGPAADDKPAQARFLAIMAEQAARMARLIDDLLSLSRIELAEHEPPATPVALAPLVARVAAGFEPQQAAGARLAVTCPEELPEVAADADQLAQVVQNLVANALKYGAWPDRPAQVSVHAAPAEGGDWPARPGVEIAVRDLGPGIARVHLPRLTERFYRVDAGRSRAGGGTGLGLAIVKHIVNRHRGALRIESEEGAGTVVRVWIPLAGRAG
jgi:two-component system phosphate regulon sensor histidine kinase PhoR